MRTLRALLVCHLALAGFLTACSDEEFEPYVPPEPPAVAAQQEKPTLREWDDPVIKDAKVSDHNETHNDLSRVNVSLLEELRSSPELLTEGDDEMRLAAIYVVAYFGPVALDLAPVLLRLLHDDSERLAAAAAHALGRMAPFATTAIAPLSGLLRSGSPVIRISAARALGRFGAGASAAVPELSRRLVGSSDEEWCGMAEGLAGIGPPAAVAVPDLVDGLRVPLRSASAAAALGRIGSAARTALPALWNTFRNGQGIEAVLAGWAIWKIDGRAEMVVPDLTDIIEGRQRGRGMVRDELLALRFRLEGKPFVGHWVTSIFRVEHMHDSLPAAVTLAGLLGPAARDSLPSLVRLLDRYSPGLKLRVAWALARIGGDFSEGFLRPLVAGHRFLDSVDRHLLDRIGELGHEYLFGELRRWPGSRGARAFAILRDRLDDERFVEELAHGTPISKTHIIAAWRTGRCPGPGFRREIRRRLADPDVTVRRAAALALVPDSASLRVLRRMLSAEETKDRCAAADALATYGPRARSAVPELTTALADPSVGVRWSAADALACIGPDARPAKRAVWNALSDPDPDVAKAAARALERIRSTRRR